MKEQLRLAILENYGLDINKCNPDFRISLNAYTINIGEYTIRIFDAGREKKAVRQARLQWARDLKEFKNTICEPLPAKDGEFVKDLALGSWKLSMSMFRTARGSLVKPDDIKPMTLISAGDMLGTMHKHAMDNAMSGKKEYAIPHAAISYEDKFKSVQGLLDPKVISRIKSILSLARNISRDPENYGICYGEFDLHNIIVDTNNIHLFDFDHTIFGHYLYDVASLAVSLLGLGYQPRRKAKDIVFNTFIPWFRVGYSINKPCKENTFDDIELFMGVRGVWLLVNLLDKFRAQGEDDDKESVKKNADFIAEILMGEDIFKGIDKVRQGVFG